MSLYLIYVALGVATAAVFRYFLGKEKLVVLALVVALWPGLWTVAFILGVVLLGQKVWELEL